MPPAPPPVTTKATLLRSVVLPLVGFAAFAAGVLAFAMLIATLESHGLKTPGAFDWPVGLLLAFGPPITVGWFIVRAAARIDAAAHVPPPPPPFDEPAPAAPLDTATLEADPPAPDAPPAPATPFETTLALAREAPKRSNGSIPLFAITLVLFFVTSGESNLTNAAILAVVLLFHELGHFAAMKIFGYENPRIFFLPLFGAATTGTKQGGPGWQEVLVLLAGPIPGIVAGVTMRLAGAAPRGTTAYTFATYLVAINAFNLLPLQALDGGRVLSRLVFSRHPIGEAIGTALMSVAMMAVGFKLSSPLLMILGVVGLIRLSPSLLLSRGATALRARWPSITGGLAHAPETYLTDLHGVAAEQLGARARTPTTIAGWMRELHERVVARPMGLAASVALLAVYGGAFLGGVVGAVLTWRR